MVSRPRLTIRKSLPTQLEGKYIVSFIVFKNLFLISLENDKIIFPDSEEEEDEVLSLPFTSHISNCAKGNTYCENLISYPRNFVKNVVENFGGYNTLFQNKSNEDDLVERSETSDRFVCASIRRMIYPQGGKDSKNQWKLIINQYEDGYVQGIMVEECAKFNRPCDIIGSLPDGIETSCKQKYAYRRLLAISDKGKPMIDTFLFPSACCCSYKRNFRMFFRSFATRNP